MTDQFSEGFTNKCCGVNIGDYGLYAVFVGDPQEIRNVDKYPFKASPEESKRHVWTACWRGYIGEYELDASGELYLVRYTYPFDDKPVEPDEVNEKLEGNFWLDFRQGFSGDRVYVPFVDGKIERDKEKWVWKTSTDKATKENLLTILGGAIKRCFNSQSN